MDYFLFLLVNANLFLRPAELVPALEKLPLYQWFILACLLVSAPKLVGLTMSQAARHPVTLCVLGIFVLVFFSHLANSDMERLAEEVFEFFKVIIYFLLFLALVNSPGKLRFLVGCVILFGVITVAASVLEYHHLIELPNLKVNDAELQVNEITGEATRIERLMLTGILHDPNEFCVFLGILCMLTLYGLSNSKLGIARFVWILPLLLFCYGIYLTKSRGGLLALLAGLFTYAVCVWGLRRAATAACLFVPVVALGLLVGGADRQASISLSEGTGRARLDLWSDWLMKFRGSPIFGEGPLIAVAPVDETKAALRFNPQQLAHNSYLQSFGDLGVLGGMLFIGAFFFAFRALACFHRSDIKIVDPNLRRLYPYLFGALVVYMTGMMSLSICYVLPTYFMLALAVSFTGMTATEPRLAPARLDGVGVRHVALASVGMLAVILMFVKVFRT